MFAFTWAYSGKGNARVLLLDGELLCISRKLTPCLVDPAICTARDKPDYLVAVQDPNFTSIRGHIVHSKLLRRKTTVLVGAEVVDETVTVVGVWQWVCRPGFPQRSCFLSTTLSSLSHATNQLRAGAKISVVDFSAPELLRN